jgi:two-component system, OmpR family, phosphate regulon sensor histidine kinase PhoR
LSVRITTWPFWLPLLAVSVLVLGVTYAYDVAVGMAFGAVGFLCVAVMFGLRLHRLQKFVKAPEGAIQDATNDELVHALRERERERQASVDALTMRLAGLQGAVDVLPDGIIVLDASHRLLWCNRTAEQLLTLRRETDALKPLSQFLREPALISALQTQFKQTVILPTTATPPRTLLYQGIRAKGDVWLIAVRDITESHRVDAMRRDFIANVSHELKTPLTVLAGFVETMREMPDLSAAQRSEALTHMQTQSDAMQRLVMDLLALSRLESTDAPASEQPFDFSALIESAVRDATALSNGRHHFVMDALPRCVLLGERDEIASAVSNLLSNAIHYTPSGGSITVRLSVEADGCVSVQVTDTGIGIAKEHIARVTERFYRVDRGRSRASGGTGLGLSIVKHIALRHQADLRIASAPGTGSTFTLSFPKTRVRQAASVASASSAAGASTGTAS